MMISYIIEKDLETGMYIGIVPSIPGAHTMGASLEELKDNLKGVIELCLQELSPEEKKSLPTIIAIEIIKP